MCTNQTVGYTMQDMSPSYKIFGFKLGIVNGIIFLWRRLRPFKGNVTMIGKDVADSPGRWYASSLTVKNRRGVEKIHYCQIIILYVKPGDLVRRRFGIIHCYEDGHWIRIKREKNVHL